MCKKCPYWHFSVCIFPCLEWIRRNKVYLLVFSPNTGKYAPEKPRIRTLFTQCTSRRYPLIMNLVFLFIMAVILFPTWYFLLLFGSGKGWNYPTHGLFLIRSGYCLKTWHENLSFFKWSCICCDKSMRTD